MTIKSVHDAIEQYRKWRRRFILRREERPGDYPYPWHSRTYMVRVELAPAMTARKRVEAKRWLRANGYKDVADALVKDAATERE